MEHLNLFTHRGTGEMDRLRKCPGKRLELFRRHNDRCIGRIHVKVYEIKLPKSSGFSELLVTGNEFFHFGPVF